MNILELPTDLLKYFNDPTYKPIFIKFVGPKTQCCVNFDLLKPISSFFDDLNSELPIVSDFEIKIDHDDVVKYMGKLFNNDLSRKDKKHLFENRKLLYLLYNQFDKYGISSMCNYLTEIIFLDCKTDSNLDMILYKKHFRAHGYTETSYVTFYGLTFLILFYEDLVNFNEIISDEMKISLWRKIMKYLNSSHITNCFKDKSCSIDCDLCFLKNKFMNIKTNLFDIMPKNLDKHK